MANYFKRIKNFNVSVREIDDNIVFLHKLVAGASTKSLGLHVAKLANMPSAILKRAQEILNKIRSKKC
jgi:DNA mismatch repair protein MutS